MIRRIYALTLHTFREAIRNKILYVILMFAVVWITSSLAFAALAWEEEIRVLKDVGLLMLTLFSVLVAIYTGVNLLYKEMDKKTIYTILSKPIERWEFLVGKFLGIWLTVGIEFLLMALLYLGLLWIKGVALEGVIFKAIFLIYVELSILSALAMFFSAFSTPLLSGLLTFLFFTAGHLHPNILALAEKDPGLLGSFLKIALYFLPDMNLYNLSTQVTYSLPVSGAYLWQSSLYGLVIIAILLIGSALIFRGRDFI